MAEQMIKIIQIDGKMPRIFVWKNNTESYKHKDEKALSPDVDDKGNEITNFYPVFEVPIDLAKVKIAQAPQRYRLFGGNSLPYQVTLPNAKREWRTAEPVGFKMSTGPVYDKDGVQVKGKATRKWFLAEANGKGKDIGAIPYAKSVKEPEVKQEPKQEFPPQSEQPSMNNQVEQGDANNAPEGDKKPEGKKQGK